MSERPRDTLESLQREVERLFHDLVYRRHPSSHFAEPTWSPPADLVVSRRDARVLLELAGVPRENVTVTIQGRILEVSGRREPPTETHGAAYHRAEIYFGDFRRIIELPWEADPATVRAVHRDGLLRIRLRRAVVTTGTAVEIESPAPAEQGSER